MNEGIWETQALSEDRGCKTDKRMFSLELMDLELMGCLLAELIMETD